MAEIYKLLVADDEYWIREQLRILVEWKAYDIEFLEPAVDGEDAWDKIGRFRPDIVITDINMPFISGVELVKRIRTEYPETVVLILSGYSDFEYVKESLLAGAVDYLLKPVEKLGLVKAFTKALDRINMQRMQEKEKRFHRESLLRATAALNDREFSEMIIRRKEQGDQGKPERPVVLKEKQQSYRFLLICIHNIASLGEVFHHDVNLRSFAIKQQIKEKLGEQILFQFNNVYDADEFIVALRDADGDMEELSYRLLLSLKDFTGLGIVIGVSDHHYAESEYPDAYEESRTAILSQNSSKNKVVLYSSLTSGSGKELIPEIARYIDAHYDEELSLQTLSELFHMDSGYLSKLFKREKDCNLIHYITLRRMEKAKEIMESETDKPLTEVAFLVGYDDYNYFNKVFRKMEHMSPREYRTKFTSNF